MRYLVTIIFFVLCGVSYGQTITGTKTRTPGVWLSSKDTATNRTAADSIQIIANRGDSSLRFYWSVGAPSRKIALTNDLALKLSISDTAAMLTNYVQKFGTLTNRRIPFVDVNGRLKDTVGFTFDGAGDIRTPGYVTSENGYFVANGTNKGFIGQSLEIGANLSGFAVGSVSNLNINGSGLAVQGGSNVQRFALKIFDYAGDSIANINTLGAYLYRPIIGTSISATSIASTGAITSTDAFISTRSANTSAPNFIPQMTTSALNDSTTVMLGRSASGPYNLFDLTMYQRVANQSTGAVTMNITDNGGKSRVQEWMRDSSIIYKPVRIAGTLNTGTTAVAANGAALSVNSLNSNTYKYRLKDNGTDRAYYGADATYAFIIANGSVTQVATVDATTGAYTATSDSAAKKNIFYSANALGLISQIKVRQYDWKTSNVHEPFGVIAQELYSITPTYVTKPTDSKGRWGVQKAEMVPMLIKGIQELKQENDTIKQELADLKLLLKAKGIL